MCRGAPLKALLDRGESKAFPFIKSVALTECLLSFLFSPSIGPFLPSIDIFMLIGLLNLLSARLHHTYGLTAQNFYSRSTLPCTDIFCRVDHQHFYSFISFTG